jgi:hypothetical protein
MTSPHGPGITQVTHPHDADAALRQQLTGCWIAVTNTGGAAGFPFPPVDADQVTPRVDKIAGQLDPQRSRMLLAHDNGALAGWVLLRRDPDRLHRLRQVARDEMGLEQLHLAARGGVGLEDFYTRLGWREVGRWPNKLRLAPDDTRDEILMALAPL